MALEFEVQRALEFVASEKKRLLPQLDRLCRERQSSLAFVKMVQRLLDLLERELPKQFAAIAAETAFDVDTASEKLGQLERSIRTLINFIAGAALSQDSVPRELYNLLDWFFSQCKSVCGQTPQYSIVCSGTELEEQDLNSLLGSLLVQHYGTQFEQSLFPALTEAFTEPKFFFIFVPASVLPITKTLDWVLICHECVHVLEDLNSSVLNLFSGLTGNWPLINRLARENDDQALEALITRELLCDFVASYVIGPAFLWRLLRAYFSISKVLHENYTHPSIDLRADRLSALLQRHGFDQFAETSRKFLADHMKDLGPFSPIPPQLSERINEAQKPYREKLVQFSMKTFEEDVQRNYGVGASQLRKEITERRPVLLEPSSLFSLTAFDQNLEGPEVAELLADCLRLRWISSEYRRYGLKG